MEPSSDTHSAKTLVELLSQRAQCDPSRSAYWTRDEGGHWTPTTWNEHLQRVLRLAGALRSRGLESGKVIGILGLPPLEWEVVQQAVLATGAVVVGLDPNERPERLALILRLARVSAVVTTGEIAELLETEAVEGLEQVLITGTPRGEHGVSLDSLLHDGSDAPLPSVSPDATATIVFTSGTTGEPKGIPFTHEQVLSAVRSIVEVYADIGPSARLVCWLPLSNLFQRIANHCAAATGAEVYIVPDPRRVMELLPEIRPTVFIAVPRFLEKVNERFEAALGEQPAPLRGLLRAALARLDRGKLWASVDPVGLFLRYRFRGLFGGRLRYCISGSAPMPVWLLHRLHRLGITVLESYGVSENVIPIAGNRPGRPEFGTVGLEFPGSEVELAEDGEVFVRSVGVLKSYVDSDASVDGRGFLKTGDLGERTPSGALRLLGRKSEVFKTSTGRKVSPTKVEAELGKIDTVDQSVAVGAGREFVVAIVAAPSLPNPDACKGLAEHVKAGFQSWPRRDRPGGLVVIQRAFSIAENELTPNLKLRRAAIERKLQTAVNRLYDVLKDPQSKEGLVEEFSEGVWLVAL